MKQLNIPLAFGILLVIPFVVVAFWGPTLAPHDPAEIYKALNVDDGWHTSPFQPGELDDFPLGTDDLGRDLLSRILWAVRPTLTLAFLVVLARLVSGTLLGLLAGWFQETIGRLVDYLVSITIAVPTLVFAVGLILLLGIDNGLLTFVIAMSLTGWPDTAVLVKSRTLSIMQESYIEGAHAIGLDSRGILWRYILPQLWPILPSLLAFELGAVILLTAELGFLGVFLGGGAVIATPDPNSLGTLLALSDDLPEIGQMLADFWGKIILAPWVPLYVGILVFTQIFAFNLLGEGLRRYMDVTRPVSKLP